MGTSEESPGARPRTATGSSGCSTGGCWAGFSSWAQSVCQPREEQPKPTYLRLQEMIQQKEEEDRRALAMAEEKEREQELKAQEWQAELRELERRRAEMDDEELEKDCLSHFATFAWLDRAASPDATPAGIRRSGTEEAAGPPSSGGDSESSSGGVEQEESLGPEGAVEQWLERHFGGGSNNGSPDGGLTGPWLVQSFGELPGDAVADLAAGLVAALRAAAEEAEAVADAAARDPSPAEAADEDDDFDRQFDRLVEKYAPMQSPRETGGAGASPTEAGDASPRGFAVAQQALELRARAARLRAVGERVSPLLPVLEDDPATSRLVAALTMLEVGSFDRAAVSVAATGDILRPGPAAPPPSAAQRRADFRAPLRALATADACWALCSEKRHLVAEGLLPGTLAQGHWSWPDLRQAALGWWLCAATCAELLDTLVRRLAQSAGERVRKGMSELDVNPHDMGHAESEYVRRLRELADEAVFWYVLLGVGLDKLRVLLRTGVLKVEPGVVALLEHQRSGEEQFMRKNAFRLLQLHRYHLAVAVFVLCGSLEEAARVVAGHMRDLQLLLVMLRKQPEVAAPMMLDRLHESSAARSDPWLRLLLAWHAGELSAVREIATDGCATWVSEVATSGSPPCSARGERGLGVGGGFELFDGVLRLCGGGGGVEAVPRVAQTLLGA